jgi:hypothetical protein
MALWPDAQYLFCQVSVKIDTPELVGIIRFSQSTKAAECPVRFNGAARDRRPVSVPPREQLACESGALRAVLRRNVKWRLQPCKTEAAGD